MSFEYKRAEAAEPGPHDIDVYSGFGQFDPRVEPWQVGHIRGLYNKSIGPMNDLINRLERVKNMDLSDYKPEAAAKKRAAEIREPRAALLDVIRAELERSQEAVKNLQTYALSFTAPEKKEGMDAILDELKYREIRDRLLPLPVEERKAVIIEKTKAGNLDFLRAAAASPFEILPEPLLTELRRAAAFERVPDLARAEADAIELYELRRAKAAELNSTMVKILMDSDIQDPITESERAEVFEPRSEREAAVVNSRIQSQDRANSLEQKREEFNKKNPGGIQL